MYVSFVHVSLFITQYNKVFVNHKERNIVP